MKMKLSRTGVCALACGLLWAAIAYEAFPLDGDPPRPARPVNGSTAEAVYYDQLYAGGGQRGEDNARYEAFALFMAEDAKIKQRVEEFTVKYGLKDKKVLEAGAGRGHLQDIVADYTGLDISETARKYFHKPFVRASAASMPFRDGEFDALWSIWTLEHVPNPEWALEEIRRVVKPELCTNQACSPRLTC
jgi:SAM-dependent methyltransferase